MDLTPWLDDLESRIDPDVEDELLAAWHDFLEGRYRGVIFSPRRRRAGPPRIAWERPSVNAALEDFDRMALQQFGGCSDALAAGGGAVLNVRANYGTGILSSLFGCRLFVMDEATGTLPTTVPLRGGVTTIRRLLDAGVPDLETGLGARVLAMGRRFRALLAPYPKLSRYVHVYHPDLQGPMDVAELVWGSDLFVDCCDEPDVVQAFLGLVTETYTAFMHAWAEIVPYRPPYSAHWGLLQRGELMLRDDSAMNFSPEMFETFVRPWDVRLLQTFDGGCMHFCGRGSHYIAALSTAPGLTGIQLSQPHLNDMETVYRHTVDRGLCLLNLHRGAAEAAVAAGRDLHGRVHSA